MKNFMGWKVEQRSCWLIENVVKRNVLKRTLFQNYHGE